MPNIKTRWTHSSKQSWNVSKNVVHKLAAMNYFKTCKLVMGSMLLFAVSGAHAQTNTEIKDFFIHSITGQTPAQQTKKTEKVKLNDLDKAFAVRGPHWENHTPRLSGPTRGLLIFWGTETRLYPSQWIPRLPLSAWFRPKKQRVEYGASTRPHVQRQSVSLLHPTDSQ